jgi:hypothetical protein
MVGGNPEPLTMRCANPSTVAALIVIATIAKAADPADALRIERVSDTVLEPEALNFREGRFGTCINGQTYQIDAVVSFHDWQYATWFDARRRLCVGRRRLNSDAWQRIAFDDYAIRHTDVHNVPVIGICRRDGTIHLAWDHHNDPLHYRVSRAGAASIADGGDWSAALFGPVRSELTGGAPLERVTYPAFFATPDGRLQFCYRIGGSGDGDNLLALYDPADGGWSLSGRFIGREGAFAGSRTRSAYHNGFDYGTDGRLHTTWVWREGQDNDSWGLLNCHDLQYACSDDHGRTWQNDSGRTIGTAGSDPMRVDSPGLTAAAIPYHWGIMNQVAQTVDRSGRVHVLLWQNPPDAPTAAKDVNDWRYLHYWREASGRWRSRQLPFCGRKPSMVVDDDGRLFVVFTQPVDRTYHGNDPGGPLRLAAASADGDWSDWHEVAVSTGAFVGEPRIDRTRWQQERVLSVYAQAAPSAPGRPSALHVMDLGVSLQR